METPPRSGCAIVFPGMGPADFAQTARFMLVNPYARRLLDTTDEVLGYPLFDRYQRAEGDYSEAAQVAFVVNCLALADWARDRMETEPSYVAGPSFGGRAAAVFSGVLSLPDAILLTARLARCMDEYFAREHPDLVTHSIIRVPAEVRAQLLAELDERGDWYEISCELDHDFIMVTLDEATLERLKPRITALGGMSLYTMKPPMHASPFAPLRAQVERELFHGLTFADPAIPVVADQDGTVRETGAGVRDMLLDGFVRTVRWPAVLNTFKDLGVGRLYVSGQDGMFGRVPAATRHFEVVPLTPAGATRPVRRKMPAVA
ncbi:ACP S-malonyltransferase [Rhizomonospora bruguierae]|uniref:ACP S-malonyltransferase n=1 Tax=Rhizomonospora bruguierae TaxID=1581705 RepID=UPI001BD15930|nr:ACP S-malonyltransferase [Micromonospora sp. NBRC 107566]